MAEEFIEHAPPVSAKPEREPDPGEAARLTDLAPRAIAQVPNAPPSRELAVPAPPPSPAAPGRAARAALPLLKAMHKESGGQGRLVEMGDRKHWAANLRAHLKAAQVDRAELYADDATRKHITFHDLKATAGTWMALRGDNPLVIKQRLAHRGLETTMLYVRAAEMVGDAVGEPFPSLPEALLGAPSDGEANGSDGSPQGPAEAPPVGASGAISHARIAHGELTMRNSVEAPGIAQMWKGPRSGAFND